MAKKNKSNILPALIILVVLLGLGVIFISHRRTVMQMDTQTPLYSPMPTPQAATGDSNNDLNQDMDTINTSINTTNSSTTDVNSGINDTPIAQPNY